MARVTIEDCLEKIDNRFELVLVAAKRARQLYLGAEPLVKIESDTIPVTALREIADGKIDASILEQDNQELSISEITSADAAAADAFLNLPTASQEQEVSDDDQYLENELMEAIRALSASMEEETDHQLTQTKEENVSQTSESRE